MSFFTFDTGSRPFSAVLPFASFKKRSHKALLAAWENLFPEIRFLSRLGFRCFGFGLYSCTWTCLGTLGQANYFTHTRTHTRTLAKSPSTNALAHTHTVAEDGRRAEDQVKSATSCARLRCGAHTKDPQTRWSHCLCHWHCCRRCRCPLRLRFGHAGRAEELGKAKLVS